MPILIKGKSGGEHVAGDRSSQFLCVQASGSRWRRDLICFGCLRIDTSVTNWNLCLCIFLHKVSTSTCGFPWVGVSTGEMEPGAINLPSSLSHLRSPRLGYRESIENRLKSTFWLLTDVGSYLELNAFQKVEVVCIHFEIFQKLGIGHIVWIIFWEWKVWVTGHLPGAVGNHGLVEAGSSFFDVVLYRQCMHVSADVCVCVHTHEIDVNF